MTALVEGHAEGELIGGNLSLLVSTLGSLGAGCAGQDPLHRRSGRSRLPGGPDAEFLALAGKFRTAPVILGTWSNCRSEKKAAIATRPAAADHLDEIIKPFNKPTIQNPGRPQLSHPTLAFGTQVRIDTSGPEVVFLEAGNR